MSVDVKKLGIVPCPICGGPQTPDYADTTEISQLGRTRQIVRYSCKREHIEQPCDMCGKPVFVNAFSPSECFCSPECYERCHG